jgi:hypothetical protein
MQLFRDQSKIREFIEDLLAKKESEDLEFKHASGGFPGSFWGTYSALAHTEGHVTNERLRFALNIHKADIYALLKNMCNANYLKAEGHGRGMKYYLPTRDNLGSNIGSNIGSNTKQRLSREELCKAIVSACPDWVSLEYISLSVGKNSDYLISKVFPAMLAEGMIERMYPQTPRHPNQKYKAVKEMNK